MIRRRSTISIYDYPEHLNPFREERRESIGNKFRSFGQRGGSFRKAWNLLLPHSKRSQSFSQASSSSNINSPEHGYDTWTARRPPKPHQEAIGLPASWTISPRRRYTPPNSVAGSPPRSLAGTPPPSPNRRGSQISVATLGTDVPSFAEGFHWQGVRPKKRRAPLPPTSPNSSSVTSSQAGSTTSLCDGQQPEGAKDAERESLRILVSRIQLEFGEEPKPSRRNNEGGKKEKELEDSVENTTTRSSLHVQKSSLQVDKAFVVEPNTSPTTASGGTAEEDDAVANENETAGKVVHRDITEIGRHTKLEEDETNDNRSTIVTKDDVIHEQQVTANVFVETTSRTISSDGTKIITSSDDLKTSDTAETEVTKIQEQPPIAAKPSAKESSSNTLDHSTIKNNRNGDNSEVGSCISSEEIQSSPSEISTSNGQVETVSGLYECGAFVVSTPDTASVYEDAASEGDLEDPEIRTTLNERFKPTVQDVHDHVHSIKKSDDASIKSFNNGAPMQTKNDAVHTKTSLMVTSDDVTPSETIPSDNLTPKTHATVIPSDLIPENQTKTNAIDPMTRKLDVSDNRLSNEKIQRSSLKYHPSTSTPPNSDSSFNVMLKNGNENMGATSGNDSPVTPQKFNGARTNGDILRTPVTAPRNKSSDGLLEQTSSTPKTVSPIASSSETTPTPPPRNKPQPVPRMKRLKKLFSNH